MKTRTLLLVGHGSSFNRDSSAPIYAHAARIRARRVFDDVRVAFWKEPPWICDALDRIETDDVCVVPMFLADGYFTHIIVPRELGVSRQAHICPPVGAHPCMADLVLERAGMVVVDRRHTALVVIGHGTERSATSSGTVLRVTRQLRERCEYQTVECGFLDQAPRIEDVVTNIRAPNVILVPFFMAEGYHTRETIPQMLSLGGERTYRAGQVIHYTRAVGTLPGVAVAAVDQASWRYNSQRMETAGAECVSAPIAMRCAPASA